MNPTELRAPFPWMGGKSRAADVLWRGFGADCVNYVEPFAGSLACLLGRPNGPGKIETVNDLSGAICNFWRAVKTNHREEETLWFSKHCLELGDDRQRVLFA